MVNTRSPEPADARERIVTAAIHRFGLDGFGASLRTIAADAEVSPALIIKHFGSKEGLRKACDERVMQDVDAIKSSAVRSPDLSRTFNSGVDLFKESQPLVQYVIRSFFSGGDIARTMLMDMQERAKEWMSDGVAAGHFKPSRNEELRIRLSFAMSLGWLFQSVLMSGKKLSELDSAFWENSEREMIEASLELYTQGLLTDSTMLTEYMQAMSVPPQEATQPEALSAEPTPPDSNGGKAHTPPATSSSNAPLIQADKPRTHS